MGRHFWTKLIGDEYDHKQPGCISGLVNVLDYHHWHSNTGKMIHHNKYAGKTGIDQKQSYEKRIVLHKLAHVVGLGFNFPDSFNILWLYTVVSC